MSILTNGEKQAIRAFIQTFHEPDKYKIKNMEELRAALVIIQKVLGERWYGKAGKDLHSEKTTAPIAVLLNNGQPKDYLRIVAFANYLNGLWDNTNANEKAREYERTERRHDIKLEHFNRFYFELKMASFYKRRGLNVNFILKPNIKNAPAIPDLEISCKDGKAYVECKKKDPETSDQSVFRSVEDGACQLFRAHKYGIVAVEVSFASRTANSDLQQVLNGLPKKIEGKFHVNAVVLCVELPYEEGEFTGIRTNFYAYMNREASIKLPCDIEKTWTFGGKALPDFPFKSLLD